MIWRLLLRSWARIRDLGLLALLADHVLTGLGSWLALVAGLAIAGAVTLVMATAAATHAKAVSTENRVNDLVSTAAALSQGKFTNVAGGPVTLTGGGVTLHCGALSQLDTETQTAFLSTLSQCANPGVNLATDPNSGTTWASGERASYINAPITRLNNALNSLQAHNFMAS